MATDAKIVAWITVNGKHIPLREGESKKDAINKAIVKDNEDIKEKQIAQRQKEADERNGKVVSADKEAENLKQWISQQYKDYGIKKYVKDSYTSDFVNGLKNNYKEYTTTQKNNAKALGLDIKDTIAKHNAEYDANVKRLKQAHAQLGKPESFKSAREFKTTLDTYQKLMKKFKDGKYYKYK